MTKECFLLSSEWHCTACVLLINTLQYILLSMWMSMNRTWSSGFSFLVQSWHFYIKASTKNASLCRDYTLYTLCTVLPCWKGPRWLRVKSSKEFSFRNSASETKWRNSFVAISESFLFTETSLQKNFFFT